jgi:predicted ATPase
MNSQIKVAITGGPSGGKTTLIETIKKDLGQKCAVVPEAASILYRGGFPRYKEELCVVHAQLAIYHTQHSLEDMICGMSQKSLVVCDRGTMDSLAYWPIVEDEFFKKVQSNRSRELARYDWVIHLDTASIDYYDTSNPIRTENFEEAWSLNSKIKEAWAGHPRRLIITHNADFITKITTSLAIIRAIMNHASSEEISKNLLL